ncbi:uncharacterized protein D12 isoform X2 [Periplaneta americana]
MSCLKRTLDGQDPDYEDNIPHEAKRLRLLEKNAKAEFSQRVSAIIQKEFGAELASRERDAHEIQERLHQAQKTLHMLRYVVVSTFYNKKQVGTEDKQKRIHPAVKKLIGKEPCSWGPLHQRPSKYRPLDKEQTSPIKEEEPREPVNKVPRYIPPKSSTSAPSTSPCRGVHKVKKRIVIGNISKWVPVDTREDSASHKWMMYVRGPRDAADVSGFVSMVRFFLHPSYRPHDIAEVTSPPFHLSRRGWGEFPVRVQIHFCHPRNKPVDVIHHLKLDRSYTGLQTLGAETVVDIWLHMGASSCDADENKTEGSVDRADCSVKKVDSAEDTVSIKENSTSVSGRIIKCEEATDSVPVVKVEENVTSSEQSLSVNNCVGVTLDHDYFGVVAANRKESETPHAQTQSKLTTLVKCMDKTGRVFYLTLGKAEPPTSLLVRKQPNSTESSSPRLLLPQVAKKPPVTVLKLNTAAKPVVETARSTTPVEQSVLIVKNGQMYLLKPTAALPRQDGKSLLKKQPAENTDSRLMLSGRTLVLNKGSSQQAMHLSRARHEDALNAALEHCKFEDIATAVRWLLRHMPLVSASAQEPEFRVLHPYTALDENSYLRWNIGKRRASEWLRAKAVQKVLRQHFPAERVWSTHAIAVWAKLHGYTPLPAPPETGAGPKLGAAPWRGSYSEPVGVMDWLVANHKADLDESDGEVDVVSIQLPRGHENLNRDPPGFSDSGRALEVLALDPHLDVQCTFVREVAREIGFKLTPQEIVPGVLFCAAERVLLEAVRSLADDLLRRALCMAWKRNSERYPGCVSLEDVHSAILSRPEFDLFSNRGLGIQVADTS